MMAEDIRFYDFGLNLLYILPPAVGDCGYISINTTQELAGDGTVEIEYRDSVLEGIIADNEANVIVSWRGFDGFLTGYINEGESRRLMGMSLCGLLHRFAVPPQTEKSATAEELARAAVSAYAPFLTLGKSAGFIVKKWIKDVDNKWIPTILTMFGAILACVVKSEVSAEIIISGAFSALASTGLHQAFKQLIGEK